MRLLLLVRGSLLKSGKCSKSPAIGTRSIEAWSLYWSIEGGKDQGIFNWPIGQLFILFKSWSCLHFLPWLLLAPISCSDSLFWVRFLMACWFSWVSWLRFPQFNLVYDGLVGSNWATLQYNWATLRIYVGMVLVQRRIHLNESSIWGHCLFQSAIKAESIAFKPWVVSDCVDSLCVCGFFFSICVIHFLSLFFIFHWWFVFFFLSNSIFSSCASLHSPLTLILLSFTGSLWFVPIVRLFGWLTHKATFKSWFVTKLLARGEGYLIAKVMI